MNIEGVSPSGDIPPKPGVAEAQEKASWASAKTRFPPWALAVGAATGLLGFGWLLVAISRTFEATSVPKLRVVMTVVAVPVLLWWSHNRRRLAGHLRILAWAAVMAIIGAFGLRILAVITRSLQRPPMWDFLCFWLNGQVAIRGLNFYDPASYQSIALPIPTGPGFVAEILDVGFWYPPPSMIFFIPLGLFSYRVGAAVWYAVQCGALAVSTVLLWKIFIGEQDAIGLVEAIAFVVLTAGTITTLQFAQSNFLALLLLLLFWMERDRGRGGVWLILGALVKPFLALLLLLPILRKNRKVLQVSAMTLLVTLVASAALFGVKTVSSYITDTPTGRLPSSVYTELSNQSLLATVLRLDDWAAAGPEGWRSPGLFVGLAILMTGITCWIVFSAKRGDTDWAIGTAMTLALLIYPGSLFHYSVLLVVPLMLVWNKRNEIPIGNWGIGLLVTGIWVLAIIDEYVFVANLLVWITVACMAVWTFVGKTGWIGEAEVKTAIMAG